MAKGHLQHNCSTWCLGRLPLQAKQRSAPPKKTRACLSQAPTKRGVCASLPAALLPVDATHVAAVPSHTSCYLRQAPRQAPPPAISAKPPAYLMQKKKKKLSACRGEGSAGAGPLQAARALPLRCAASAMSLGRKTIRW
jgi:hypothetical protein